MLWRHHPSWRPLKGRTHLTFLISLSAWSSLRNLPPKYSRRSRNPRRKPRRGRRRRRRRWRRRGAKVDLESIGRPRKLRPRNSRSCITWRVTFSSRCCDLSSHFLYFNLIYLSIYDIYLFFIFYFVLFIYLQNYLSIFGEMTVIFRGWKWLTVYNVFKIVIIVFQMIFIKYHQLSNNNYCKPVSYSKTVIKIPVRF